MPGDFSDELLEAFRAERQRKRDAKRRTYPKPKRGYRPRAKKPRAKTQRELEEQKRLLLWWARNPRNHAMQDALHRIDISALRDPPPALPYSRMPHEMDVHFTDQLELDAGWQQWRNTIREDMMEADLL